MKPLAILVMVLLAAGCSSGETPITIIVKEGGCFVLDGRNIPTQAELQQTLLAEAHRTRGGPRPRVAIRFESPERTPYEDLARAVLACGAANFEKLEIEGVPLSLPTSGHYWVRPDPFSPAFAPIEIHGIKDLDAFQGRPDLFRGRGIMIKPGEDTPADLVLAAMRRVHEAGGKIALAFPYDTGEDGGKTLLTLSHRPLDRSGEFVPVIVRPFREDPFPDMLTYDPPTLPGDDVEDRPRIVYVVDGSGSMTGSIDFAKYELKQSLVELEDTDEFHVIFFSSGPPLEMPARRLVNATERNKETALEFIDGVLPQGEADPSAALKRAFACRPDFIYILTHGDPDREVADLVHHLNADKKVTVHVVCFLYRPEGDVLKQIAEENGGRYKFLSEKDLAKLAW